MERERRVVQLKEQGRQTKLNADRGRGEEELDFVL